MNDEIAKLESAIRAQDALIVEAQAEMARYLRKEIECAELIDRLLKLLDGPQQRETERLVREAMGEDFGNLLWTVRPVQEGEVALDRFPPFAVANIFVEGTVTTRGSSHAAS